MSLWLDRSSSPDRVRSSESSAMPFKIPTPLSQASGEKRASSAGEASSQAKKPKSLPPLDDLVAMESATKKPNARRLPTTAPLNICVYKITDRAGDAWSQFEGVPSAKLWQVQMDHGARPSCLFDLRGTSLCRPHPTHSLLRLGARSLEETHSPRRRCRCLSRRVNLHAGSSTTFWRKLVADPTTCPNHWRNCRRRGSGSCPAVRSRFCHARCIRHALARVARILRADKAHNIAG